MNTDKNSQSTQSGTPAQSEQTVSRTTTRSTAKAPGRQTNADTKKLRKFEATLFWTQHNQTRVIIEAATLAEAEEMAGDIQSDEIDDWNAVDGDLSVESVEPVKEGSDNE